LFPKHPRFTYVHWPTYYLLKAKAARHPWYRHVSSGHENAQSLESTTSPSVWLR